MKSNWLIGFFLITSPVLKAQNEFFIISDKDGFVNVRSKPNAGSQVICQLETPVPPEDSRAAKLAVGRTVTCRGKVTFQSARSILLEHCTFE